MMLRLLAGAVAPLALLVSVEARADELPVIGSVSERAWTYEANAFTPRGDFQEEFRDIGGASLEIGHAWRFSSGLEARMSGGYFHASGERREPFSNDPPISSNADGVTIAFGARYYLPEIARVRVFGEGMAGFVWTPDDPFPGGGTAANGITRWGAGASYRMNDDWTLEAGYRQTHMSNGGGIVGYNPAWETHNTFIGLRRRVGEG